MAVVAGWDSSGWGQRRRCNWQSEVGVAGERERESCGNGKSRFFGPLLIGEWAVLSKRLVLAGPTRDGGVEGEDGFIGE